MGARDEQPIDEVLVDEVDRLLDLVGTEPATEDVVEPEALDLEPAAEPAVEPDPPVYDERGNVRPHGTPGARPMTYAERMAIAERLAAGEVIVTEAEVEAEQPTP